MKNTDIWNYDLLMDMPEVSIEKAKERWLKLKDSESPSDKDQLAFLYAKIVFQEICYVCEKYGFDIKMIFSRYDLKRVLEFCSDRDLTNGFFWADLYEEIRDKSIELHVKLKNGKWIKSDQYRKISEKIYLIHDKPYDEVIKEISINEGTSIDLESLKIIYNEVQSDLVWRQQEDKFHESFYECISFKDMPDSQKDYYYDKLINSNDRTKRVLIDYFGIIDGRPKTVREISGELHVSTERVSSCIRSFIRRPLKKSKNLKDFLEE